MKWAYHRLKGVSKWVSGNNWVTKHDNESFCHIGFNGRKILPIGKGALSVKGARQLIEILNR